MQTCEIAAVPLWRRQGVARKAALLSPSMSSRVKIFNALEKLLQEEELDSITVREICEEADVGRATFYAYFKDKYDVVLWYEVLTHETGVGQIGRTLTWEEGNRRTCEGILAKVDMLNKAARSNDRNAINPYSQRWRIDKMEETLTEYIGVEIGPRLHYQVSGLAAAQAEIATEYFNDPNRCSIEEFVEVMSCIVPRELYALLEEPAAPKEEDGTVRDMELALTIVQMMQA